MFGVILPGMVVLGVAASPIVAAAMANVWPNRVGDWVDDNLIPLSYEEEGSEMAEEEEVPRSVQGTPQMPNRWAEEEDRQAVTSSQLGTATPR